VSDICVVINLYVILTLKNTNLSRGAVQTHLAKWDGQENRWQQQYFHNQENWPETFKCLPDAFFIPKFTAMRYLLGIVLLLHSFIVLSQSEDYNFSKLNTFTGLSHNQVNAVLKDRDGFLWFGTSYGLNRYDGYFCRIFRKDHNDSSSLKDNNIISLYELPDMKMWLSTTGGPCIYSPDTEKFNADYNNYLQSIGLPTGAITNIVKGYNGRYWFLYGDRGLYLYSVNNKSVKPFKPQGIIQSSGKITAIKETTEGKLWLVYQSGFLQEYDLKQEKIIFSSMALQKLHDWKSPFSLFVDNDGDIWLWSYNSGLFFFHPQDNTIRRIGKNSFPARLNSAAVTC
jgi:ligand-binding sensor domain-containing protein